MNIEIQIDENCRTPKIIIVTDCMTEEVSEIMRRLSEEQTKTLTGFRDGAAELLAPEDVLRIYAANGRVYAWTERSEYQLRLRLYELEQRLDRQTFVRISNSEIINLKRERKFDLSLSGTICVILSDGTAAYVSRRYVARIKQLLGL